MEVPGVLGLASGVIKADGIDAICELKKEYNYWSAKYAFNSLNLDFPSGHSTVTLVDNCRKWINGEV